MIICSKYNKSRDDTVRKKCQRYGWQYRVPTAMTFWTSVKQQFSTEVFALRIASIFGCPELVKLKVVCYMVGVGTCAVK